MRNVLICSGMAAAFAAGLITARLVPVAQAQGSPPALTAQIVDLAAMTDAQIGPLIPNTAFSARRSTARWRSRAATC